MELSELIATIPRLMKLVLNDFKASSLNFNLNKTQRKALLFLQRYEGFEMSRISRFIGLEKGSFTTLTDKLIQQGLVTRDRTEKDRRKILLRLTEKGQEYTTRLKIEMRLHIEEKLSVLTDEEKTEFLHALTTLNKTVELLEQRKKRDCFESLSRVAL